jgi:annexin A7/11
MGCRACGKSSGSSQSSRGFRVIPKPISSRSLLIRFRTDETLLNELILARPTSEIRILTEAFRLKHGEIKGSITKEVKDDLSLETARSEYRSVFLRLLYLILSLHTVFELALDTSRPDDTVLDRAAVEKDVDALYHTGRGNHGKEKVFHHHHFLLLISTNEPLKFYEILVKRSFSHTLET